MLVTVTDRVIHDLIIIFSFSVSCSLHSISTVSKFNLSLFQTVQFTTQAVFNNSNLSVCLCVCPSVLLSVWSIFILVRLVVFIHLLFCSPHCRPACLPIQIPIANCLFPKGDCIIRFGFTSTLHKQVSYHFAEFLP